MHRLVVNVLKSVMPLLFILLCSVSIYAQQATPTPSTEVSLAGKWASNWGPVELGSDLTGSWNQGVGIGQFTSGSYDAQTRRVEFQYYQPWNKMYGHCVMSLSADNNTISGTWAQQRAGQKTGSGGSGTWTMTRSITIEKHDPNPIPSGLKKTIDIFIGGFFDETTAYFLGDKRAPVKGYYTDYIRHNPDDESHASLYYTHDQEDRIISDVKKLPSDTIIQIIGHSYGADTAVDVVGRCGRRISLLVTVDPVGGLRTSTYPGTPKKLISTPSVPILSWQERLSAKSKAADANTDKWIDIDAQPTEKNFSDYVAAWGGKWDVFPDTPIKYDTAFILALGCHHADFSDMMSYVTPPGSRIGDISNITKSDIPKM